MTQDIVTDVLVCGGGPSGFAAAVSASKLGVKVLLAERYGFLGGMATAGLVNPFMVSKMDGEYLVKGVFEEVVAELINRNACAEGELFGQPHIVFDPEILKFILTDMAEKAGVKFLLHSSVVGALLKEQEIKGVVTSGKSGEIRIFSKIVIDATGDGDIAAFAGAPFEKGRESDGLMQPMTMNFNIGGVETGKMPSREEINAIYLKAKNAFAVRNPRENVLWFETVRKNELHFNSTRMPRVDGTDTLDLTKAEIEGRKQVEALHKFLKENIPGFEGSYITSVAAQAGVRESRRIKGGYVLTEDDVISGKKFEDAVAKCNYPIDIHDPKAGESTVFKKLGPAVFYEIPYRCLIPGNIENLIVTGRAISVSHEALSSTRVMPTCMALGQAAGVAAALSVKKAQKPRNMNNFELQNILNEQGAGLRGVRQG